MGLAIENSNVITKMYNENQDMLVKAMTNQYMRVTKIQNVHYKLSYIMSSSFTGKELYETEEGDGNWVQEPLDTQVTLNLQLEQFSHEKYGKKAETNQFRVDAPPLEGSRH